MTFLDKLSKIEALIERSSSEGERQAAILAKERIQQRQDQHPKEYRVTVDNPWKKRLFVTLCNKYGYSTYRYKGQRYTTSLVRASPALMDEILWPEFQRFADMLEEAVGEIIDGLIQKIHTGDLDEVEIAGQVESSGS